MRAIATCALLGLLATPTQEPSRQRAWSELRARLDASDLAIERSTRIELLARFILRWTEIEAPASPEILAARSRIVTLHLAGFDAERALQECDRILESAPPTALDARGLAHYGRAQALLLAEDSQRAHRELALLRKDFVGTRWADLATVALVHLDTRADEAAAIGKPAPEFGPRLDRTGRSRDLGAVRGAPALLIFVSTADEAGLEVAAVWLARARRAGLASEQILVFGIGDPIDAINDLARRSNPPAVLLPAPAGFLDPAALRYQIRAIPSSVLVGPDATILARDLPATRLESALTQLLR